MQKKEKKENIVKYKLLYTVLILFVYLIGRSVPLYGIDVSAHSMQSMNAQDLLMQTISGDRDRSSLFALGVSPYMMGTIIVQVMAACRNPKKKGKLSPKRINQYAVGLTMILASVQAIVRMTQLEYTLEGEALLLAKGITVLEMITGVLVILWLCERNKKYGIGGQTAIIYVNILDGIIVTLTSHKMESLKIPMCIAIVVLVIVLILENAEKRIPVQRISIHNNYTDKNYLAIKLNPIGIMPVMFSTGFFILPQLLLAGFVYLYPENEKIVWLSKNMNLTQVPGIIVYLMILYILTIGFSFVFISPRDMTEQFLKSGDSILNLHAGKDTKKYLSRELRRISFFSATIMGICLGVPMFLQIYGKMESDLLMFPSSIMMLTGIWCNLYQEILAVKGLESYRRFI